MIPKPAVGVLKLGRAMLLAFTLNLPPYLVNLGALSLMLWYSHVSGVANIPFVFVGDGIGFATGVFLSYFGFSKSKRIRKWGGSNEKDRCPNCGAEI